MRKSRTTTTEADTVTIKLHRDEAAFLRRLLGSVRAFGTETTSVTRQHFFSSYDDWLEHIDAELARALAHGEPDEEVL
jgi:hypothetical protein